MSKADTDLVIRLYIQEQLRKSIILKYHDYNGHMGIDKTYETVKGKYYWPCMYKELYKCTNSHNLSDPKLDKTTPKGNRCSFLPFVKLCLDISGPFPKAFSGKKYIIGFVDRYSGW